MGRSVLLLSRYERRGPSSRVRHYNYLPALARAGFQITAAPLLDDAYLDRMFRGDPRSPMLLAKAYLRRLRILATARRYDLIWIEKEALPWLPAAAERAFMGDRLLVIDYDDPWYLRYTNDRRVPIRHILGHKLESIAKHAAAITAGSPALAQWARSAKAKVVVEMPPAIDVERYPVRPPPDGPFTVGWIGTPTNEAYLELIAGPLRHLHDRFGARLRLIGDGRNFGLRGVNIERVDWSEETEADALAGCHVGVMPLSDGPWERGKCGYKLIQYMAAARPSVASAVGASGAIIVPGETGFLADSAEEWMTALGTLAANRERVWTMGLAARKRAETTYSLGASASKLIELFNEALASAGVGRAR
jgi:glycosyltransferase involved in cell wall biosynthesis